MPVALKSTEEIGKMRIAGRLAGYLIVPTAVPGMGGAGPQLKNLGEVLGRVEMSVDVDLHCFLSVTLGWIMPHRHVLQAFLISLISPFSGLRCCSPWL